MDGVYGSLNSIHRQQDTICALATPPGIGAIAVIRISGKQTFTILSKIFVSARPGFDIFKAKGNRIYFGKITDQESILDEVLLSVFKGPKSYTGEDIAEISCHGSIFIQQKMVELILRNGARLAAPGEYTMRAFFNGKFDLSQAEAVADLIHSSSQTSHDLAMNQMRGGYSDEIKQLRRQLLDFASLIELELDFSEEDVEFADRSNMLELIGQLQKSIKKLIESFSTGNVIRHGIPVAIVGKPNVGKSTLLNAILNEERAIVSDIPGTTRDTIEDTIILDGICFRFIDTAGLRQSGDTIEAIGIERTYEKINQARMILYVFDVSETSIEEINESLLDFQQHIESGQKTFILVANKTDLLVETPKHFGTFVDLETIFASAKRKEGLSLISDLLVKTVRKNLLSDQTIVSNSRHYEALIKASEALNYTADGLIKGIPTDLIATDVRSALHYLGEITGQVSTEELLGNIFGKFCIGK